MKILLIEDDDMTRELLVAELSASYYAVEQAIDGELGLELASLWGYDLILLDLQIPKLDGLSVCRQLRNRGITTPILMLTAHNAKEDIVTGLDTGADDYVTKPFEVGQVLARIRALLRRGDMTSTPTPSLRWGKLCLNPATTVVTYEDRVISLTPKEYSLLELFLRHPQRVFSRSNILDHLWSLDDYPTEGAVTNLVKDLRNRLKRSGIRETIIQTVYGLGYRLNNNLLPESDASGQQIAEAAGTSHSKNTLVSIAARFQSSIRQRVGVLEDGIRAFQAGGTASAQRQLACKEAHRLAGGLGTFGYEAGSALAGQMEQILQGDAPLNDAEIATLSQNLLALKQSVAVEPELTQVTTTETSSPRHQLLAVNVPNEILLPLKSLTSGYNWSIEAFSHAEDALNLGDNHPIDAILLYLDPTAGPGQKFSTLKGLNHRWPRLPVTVLSSQEGLEERVQAVRLGAERYLVTPLAPEKLMNTLTELVTPSRPLESRVIVVDDSAEVCTTIIDLLSPWGIQVITLGDASQFWQVLRRTVPDLLLLKQDMPTFSGIDLCQVVRKDSQYGDLPILMMTTQSNRLSVQQMFELGCDDLIHKPIIGPEVITRVLSRIERSRLRQQLETMHQQKAVYWHRPTQIDPLTLMASARFLDTFLQQQWERHRQGHAPLSLILCLPDKFNAYQQSYGFQAADQLLRHIAQMLQSIINPNIDLAARYSAEAFGLVLPNTNLTDALGIANQIQQAIQKLRIPGSDAPNQEPITLSLGIGWAIPSAAQPCDDLLKTADQALQTAKARGGNTFCFSN